MESGKVLLGVLAGIAIGSAFGILLAPEKGSVTRKKILKKGEDYTDELTEKLDNFIEESLKKYEDAIHKAEDLYTKGKSRYEEMKDMRR
jgi:gas vesicle protein